MTKTINLKDTRTRLFAVAFIVTLLVASLYAASVEAAITSSLDFGDNGANVTELQTYLATNASIYPSGLVTGYYGPLTRAAVERFQTAQGIVSSGTPESTGYGRVGPTTMARINSLLGGGITNNVSWDTVPVLTTPSVTMTNTTATFQWSTNEVTTGQVFWSPSPLSFDEATGPRQQPYVSGTLALDAGGMQTNHTVTVSNLQSNTVYYYLVRAIDNVGNVTIVWPQSFRTN
jgi:peptidoglycan hydrolase-like protein with peptidoglycan-binding domain